MRRAVAWVMAVLLVCMPAVAVQVNGLNGLVCGI